MTAISTVREGSFTAGYIAACEQLQRDGSVVHFEVWARHIGEMMAAQGVSVGFISGWICRARECFEIAADPEVC